MMKLNGSNPWRAYDISRVLRAVFYSAKTSPSSSPRNDSLYGRLVGVGGPTNSVTPVLDKWIKQGRMVSHPQLQTLIKRFRKYRRYSHALQMHDWMCARPLYKFTSGGMAVRLDLLSKAQGLDKAEEYFNTIPDSLRDDKVNSAMLNCYAFKNSLDKAEELFDKMMALGHVKRALVYNVMLSLYSRLGKHKKVNNLVQKMEENGIKADNYTSNIRLSACAKYDVGAMDKLLTQMEADPRVTVNFHGYFSAAKGYLNNGLSNKALEAIKKAEEQITKSGNRIFYEILIKMYAGAGRKDDVYRIWNAYKSMGRLFNTGYLSMVSALLKLDDVDGAEEIFKEWVSVATFFDIRIESLFITAYCKKGLVEKAFERAERCTKSGHELQAGVWQCLATQSCVDGEMAKAVEAMKKVIVTEGAKPVINFSTLASCLEYLKGEGDVETAHEILRLLRESRFSDELCSTLKDFVNSDEKTGALAAMKDVKT